MTLIDLGLGLKTSDLDLGLSINYNDNIKGERQLRKGRSPGHWLREDPDQGQHHAEEDPAGGWGGQEGLHRLQQGHLWQIGTLYFSSNSNFITFYINFLCIYPSYLCYNSLIIFLKF